MKGCFAVNKVAIVCGDITIYWHAVVMVFAMLMAIVASLIVYRFAFKRKISEMLCVAAISIPFGILGARIMYCAILPNEFDSFIDVLRLWDGGYALYGAIFGVLLAALFAKATVLERGNFGVCCDSIAIGGALGISVGRMSSYFSLDNVGIAISSSKLCFFPVSIYDPDTDKWYLASFVADTIIGFGIFMLLCVMLVKLRKKLRSGDLALVFMMAHGAFAAVLDSMHSDSLRFSFNSFIRVQQIVGIVCFVVVTVIFMVRAVKATGKFRSWQVLLLLAIVAMVGIAAYMELSRISDVNYFRNHIIMMITMFAAVVLCLVIYAKTLESAESKEVTASVVEPEESISAESTESTEPESDLNAEPEAGSDAVLDSKSEVEPEAESEAVEEIEETEVSEQA